MGTAEFEARVGEDVRVRRTCTWGPLWVPARPRIAFPHGSSQPRRRQPLWSLSSATIPRQLSPRSHDDKMPLTSPTGSGDLLIPSQATSCLTLPAGTLLEWSPHQATPPNCAPTTPPPIGPTASLHFAAKHTASNRWVHSPNGNSGIRYLPARPSLSPVPFGMWLSGFQCSPPASGSSPFASLFSLASPGPVPSLFAPLANGDAVPYLSGFCDPPASGGSGLLSR